MTVPSTYATDFLHSTLPGPITDVQDIIDAIVDDLTVNLPVDSRWTDEGGGVYKSPVQDAGGANRFMTLELAADSTTRISWNLSDAVGGTVQDGSFDIVSGDVDTNIFTGPCHCICEAESVGTGFEHGMAFLTDPGVFGLGSTSYYVSGRTTRNAGGSVYGGGNPNNYYSMRDASSASTPTGRSGGFTSTGVSPIIIAITTAGSTIAIPLDISINIGSSQQRYSGRAYQIVCLPRTFIGPEIDVPLDEATIGTFRKVVLDNLPGGSQNIVVAVRVG